MDNYYDRIMDTILSETLKTAGAVQIVGPKWCGKSTTAEKLSKSAVFMQDYEHAEQNISLAKNSPSTFLQGDTPRLIDEWQLIPFIWNQIRYEVDKRRKNGQFILTGSSTPSDAEFQQIVHSGIGRIACVKMRPMTIHESKDGNGSVSLEKLFNGEKLEPSECKLSLQDYAYLVCRGGWPSCIGLEKKYALEQSYNYVEGLINRDINTLFRRSRNPEKLRKFLRVYSRGISSETSICSMKEDWMVHENEHRDEDTISGYIDALERLYVIEELPAWNPNLRSKTAVRTSNTRHFVDPSIACASLGIGPENLMQDMKTFGLLFESMCIRDLRVYAEKLHGYVNHYRDKKGLEADAVIHLRDGRWAAVEVKLASQDSIDEGAKHLLKLASDVNTEKTPSFLMILTATKYAYQREDGVLVVPIGCLRD